ncbi:MAG: prolyl oligopeptidase family serine peptidase, partial [Candidatus Hydrogenedentes bacterium]|nr:prolyl oligopeptidase family serine peptidase [Candidatus Hydrogenedentota bacterium]
SPIKRNFGSFQDRVKQLAQVPIYAFHGADDEVVPPARSQQMVKLVKEAGGKVKYKEFAKTGHNAWDQAYASEDAIKWLFKQKKP